ncbi:MAG: hypothetical protein ABII00_02960 [Elusimicrobiota bacterium]
MMNIHLTKVLAVTFCVAALGMLSITPRVGFGQTSGDYKDGYDQGYEEGKAKGEQAAKDSAPAEDSKEEEGGGCCGGM